MGITIETEKCLEFKKLTIGETFRYGTNHYIKIEGERNAVMLCSGLCDTIAGHEKVVVVDIILTIKN